MCEIEKGERVFSGPWPRGRRSRGVEGARQEAGVGAGVATCADPPTPRRRLEDGRCSGSGGDVFARGAARWVALLGRWAGEGAGRGREAEAGEDAGCSAGGGNRGNGLRATAAGSVAMDIGIGRRGGEAEKDRGDSGPRDDPQDADPPRAEAVAEK